MALTNNKISIKNLVAKFYQDLDLKDETDIGRLIEWCAEVIGKIGVYTQLENKSACIKIKNYKAEIPCDLVYLHEVEYNGYQLSKGPSNTLERKKPYNYYLTPKAVNEYKIQNINYFLGMKYYFPKGDSFIMQNGWFKTSFKEGTININYDALPMDDEGYPLVPDNESFRDALFWYCAYKWFFIQAIKEDRFKWFYQDAETKYRYYIQQAGAGAMMPDLFTLENIKRNFIRMVPKINDYTNLFSNLNTNG